MAINKYIYRHCIFFIWLLVYFILSHEYSYWRLLQLAVVITSVYGMVFIIGTCNKTYSLLFKYRIVISIITLFVFVFYIFFLRKVIGELSSSLKYFEVFFFLITTFIFSLFLGNTNVLKLYQYMGFHHIIPIVPDFQTKNLEE